MKPRIFISAVTSELRTTRQLVANVVLRLGYDPVTQDIFGTEAGDLRQVLRDKIDDCDGLIQLVGRGYGAEPPTIGDEFTADGFTRVSYTQFEFLYGRAKEKNSGGRFKTWLIYADDGCTRDRPLEQLDLPRDPQHPDPADYQAERRELQEAWRQRWKQEGHLRHSVSSDIELELKIERLKDEFAELRREFRGWQSDVSRKLVIVALLLVAIGGGVWWTVFRQPGQVQRIVEQTIAQQLAALKPDEIKNQLRKTIEETYQREVQVADKLTDWQKRDEAKRDAAATRDKHLGQVDEFLASITSTIKAGDATPEFLELTRIIQEQGVDQALAYITRQESGLLERAEKLAAQTRREIRRTLAPLLEGVRLHRSKGELAEARSKCDKLLKQDADWLDVLHEHCWTMIELGDRATKYETVKVALAHFEAAEASAKRLVAADAKNPVWQRNLSASFNRLGDVYLTLGRTDDALKMFEDGLKLSRVLAEDDPNDAQKQRDLSISFNRIGDVYLQLGRTDDALTQFQDGLKISRELAEANPQDCQNQRDLAYSLQRLGKVFLKIGRTDDAIPQFRAYEKLCRVLAEADPNNAKKQRDLSVSFNEFGDVFLTLGRTDDALTQFQDGLKISRVLAEADPNDAQKQSDLSVSLNKLGLVFLKLDRSEDALAQFQASEKICRALAEADPNNALKQRELAVSIERLGQISLERGMTNEAVQYFSDELMIAERRMKADPSDVEAKRFVSVVYAFLGDAFLKLGRTDDALMQAHEGMKIRRILAEADPRDTQKLQDLWYSIYQLGDMYLNLGRTEDALMQFQDGLKIRRVLAEADPANVQCQVELAISYNYLGHTWLAKKQPDKALEQFEAGMVVSDHGLSTNDQFFSSYNLACYHSLRVLVHSLKHGAPNEPQIVERKLLQAKAIQMLKDVIEAGHQDFAGIRRDPDFRHLHGLPDFEALFPKQN